MGLPTPVWPHLTNCVCSDPTAQYGHNLRSWRLGLAYISLKGTVQPIRDGTFSSDALVTIGKSTLEPVPPRGRRGSHSLERPQSRASRGFSLETLGRGPWKCPGGHQRRARPPLTSGPKRAGQGESAQPKQSPPESAQYLFSPRFPQNRFTLCRTLASLCELNCAAHPPTLLA